MRKLLRRMAKAKMAKAGVTKINRRMSHGRWREVIYAYPINAVTGRRMPRDYWGRSVYPAGSHSGHLFRYSNYRHIQERQTKKQLRRARRND